MWSRKKYSVLLFSLFLIIISRNVSAQFICDPNDRIYKFISIWQEKGIISRLPPIRPYPLQLVRTLLEEIRTRGDRVDIKIANDYYASLFPETSAPAEGPLAELDLRGQVHPGIRTEFWTETEDLYWKLAGSVDTTGSLGEYLSFAGLFAYSLMINPGEEFFPAGSDVLDESESGGGVIELGSVDIDMTQLGIGSFALGTDRIYFQAGLMRTSFGPFFENGAVIGPQAPAAGHFSLTLRAADWLTLSSIFMDLAADYMEYPDTGTKTSIGEPVQKYLILHSVNFYPCDWFAFGYIQTVIAGDRLNPAYLIPIQHTFFTQQLYGDWDSSLLGLYAQVNFPLWFQASISMYIDDWDAFSSEDKQTGTGINLDSAQNKYALQVGLAWSPSFEVFKRISLDYLLITPYMYTHSVYAKIDFLSYTHAGQGIGSVLQPNSDQITLKTFLTLADWLDLDIWSRFKRHGNASEDYDRGDGTYYDDGFYDGDTVTFYGPSRFLTQRTIEYILQAGFDIGFSFPFSWGSLFAELGYVFEYIWNRDLSSGYNELSNFFYISLGVKF